MKNSNNAKILVTTVVVRNLGNSMQPTLLSSVLVPYIALSVVFHSKITQTLVFSAYI